MRIGAVALALAVVGVALPARASVCCGDPAGLGDRLGRHEVAAASLGQDVRLRLGSYDADGEVHGLAAGDSEVGLRWRAAWTVRLVKRLELGLSLPVVATFASQGGESGVGAGVGDVVVGARLTVVQLPVYEAWPGLSLTTAVVAPTGRPAWSAESPLGVDVTGQGVPELRLGFMLEEVVEGRWFAIATGLVGVFAGSDAGGRLVRRAPRLGLSVVTGPVLDDVAIGVGLEHEAEAAPSIEGLPTSGGRRRTQALATAIVEVGEHAALVPTVRAALPIAGLGRAETADLSAGVALRVGWEGR